MERISDKSADMERISEETDKEDSDGFVENESINVKPVRKNRKFIKSKSSHDNYENKVTI